MENTDNYDTNMENTNMNENMSCNKEMTEEYNNSNDGLLEDHMLNSYILSLEEKYKEFPEVYDKYGFLKNGEYLSDPNFKHFFNLSLYDYINVLKAEGEIKSDSDIQNGFLDKMHEEYLQRYCEMMSKDNNNNKSSVQLLREQRERRAAKENMENNNNNNNTNNN